MFHAGAGAGDRGFLLGPYDSRGTVLYPGKALGSEREWINLYIPNARNGNAPTMLVARRATM
ncbi:MAG: hypothetical protein R3F26_04150 [Gammaproteobacteria bacterium]